MKKKMIMAMAMVMLLSGCAEIKVTTSDIQEKTSSATTAAVTEEKTTKAEAETTSVAKQETASAAESAADTGSDAAVQEETEETIVQKNPFEGTYSESNSGRGIITVTDKGDFYNINIHWAGSAFECAEWDFTGMFNGRQVLTYSDCVKKHLVYSEDGSCTSETIYTDGTGTLRVSEDGEHIVMTWKDDVEDEGSGYYFYKQE